MLKHNPFDLFLTFLTNQKLMVRKEICWIISNIVATSPASAEKVLENESLLSLIFSQIQNDCQDVKH